MPNDSAMFAIRIGVKPGDAADLKTVNALQKKFVLTSLDNWSDPNKHGKVDPPKLSARPSYTGDLAFYQTLADLLIDNPPPKEGALRSSCLPAAASTSASRWMLAFQ